MDKADPLEQRINEGRSSAVDLSQVHGVAEAVLSNLLSFDVSSLFLVRMPLILALTIPRWDLHYPTVPSWRWLA